MAVTLRDWIVENVLSKRHSLKDTQKQLQGLCNLHRAALDNTVAFLEPWLVSWFENR